MGKTRTNFYANPANHCSPMTGLRRLAVQKIGALSAGNHGARNGPDDFGRLCMACPSSKSELSGHVQGSTKDGVSLSHYPMV